MYGLEGSVAIVTGGGKGIGKGITTSLVRAGVKVCINYNATPDMAEATCAALRAEGADVFTYGADISDKAQCKAMAEETVKRFGRLDILVNNAALQTNDSLVEATLKGYKRLMDVNVKGMALMMQACLPYLKQSPDGRIVNISSVHGKRPTDSDVVYSMSKGALQMLTREAAIEFGQWGITVNSILPGGTVIEGKTNPGSEYGNVENSSTTAGPEGEDRARYPGGVGMPHHSGDLIVYLSSHNAGHLTGAAIRLDGGLMIT